MGFVEVGKARVTKSGRGIIIELEMPHEVWKRFLTISKKQLRDVIEGKRQACNVSLITGMVRD